jgi:DNA-binding winged helix-turn-helix (wHTH) protein
MPERSFEFLRTNAWSDRTNDELFLDSVVPSKEAFIPLLALPLPWSAESGLPKETVLRRLCEWAMCDGFPEGAFRDVHDKKIRPFDIYMSHRAIIEMSLFPGGGVSLGFSTMYNTNWGWEVLDRVLVRAADLEFFCEKTDTEPFWRKPAGFFSFLTRRPSRAHLAPPPCPEAEAFAIRYDAKQSADGCLHNMKRRLDRLTGKDDGRKPSIQEVNDGPIDFDEWNKSWAADIKSVLQYLEISPDPDFRDRLHRLNSEWEIFRKENESAVPGNPSTAEPPVQLRIFPAERRLILRGSESRLPEKQFRLLCCLAEAALTGSSVVGNRKIEDRVWGDDASKIYRPVSDVVRDLRKALKAASNSDEVAELITNVPGEGYFLDLPARDIQIEIVDAGAPQGGNGFP